MVLNSLNKIILIFLRMILILLEIIQIDGVIIIKNVSADIQFNDTLDEVDGSKIENRLVIIFSLFLSFEL
jgi:hypothetical protein